MFCKRGKRGQVALFVIVAVVVVVGALVYVSVQNGLFSPDERGEFGEIYEYFESCIEQETRAVAALAGAQGGIVDVDFREQGSEYAPFGSQLDFLGFEVPYWYYVSGNGVIKEKVPEMNDIEEGMEEFIGDGLEACDFSVFEERGVEIKVNEDGKEVKVNVEESSILVDVDFEMVVSDGKRISRRGTHSVQVGSNFGGFYNQAKEIYAYQSSVAFLENYSVDVLRLYAPVDGVEIQCNPKTWKTREVVENLKLGLESNIGALKMQGDYYRVDEKGEYFVVDQNVEHATRFLYSQNWPSKVEIAGAGQEVMIAEPIGTEQGLGVLGFCYAPYHFVYDVKYPVMVQIYDDQEMFQFPVVVVIDKNLPREGYVSDLGFDIEEDEICEFATQDLEVGIFDSSLNEVDASLSFVCFNQKCDLGESESGRFVGKVPACLNGQLVVEKEGFADHISEFSSNQEDFMEVILDPTRNVEIKLRVDGEELEEGETALISFEGVEGGSIFLPEAKNIDLSEGFYNLSVYVYGGADVVIPASSSRQCYDVPKSGVLGFFGGSNEECTVIEIPESKIEQSLIGGGIGQEYLLLSELDSGELVLEVSG